MCVCVAGTSTYRQRPLSCVTRSQTLSVYTSDPSRHAIRPPPTLCPSGVPKNLSVPLETRGQRLGVDLEVVVPDWLSDPTDGCRPDGRYDRRSEVKGAIKNQKVWLRLVWIHCQSLSQKIDLSSCERRAFKVKSPRLSLTEVSPKHRIIPVSEHNFMDERLKPFHIVPNWVCSQDVDLWLF